MNAVPFKSGFVGIIGKPNAGKSTLLNALVGKKLAIATPKPQTTRHRILGILHGEGYQVIFSDTPGVILPQYRLQKTMMNAVRAAVDDADLVLLLIDVNEKFPEDELIRLAKDVFAPILLVVNKADQADPDKVTTRVTEIRAKLPVKDVVVISALHGMGLLELRDRIVAALPEGPPYYDPEMLSDRPERFFVAEIIREKIFLNLTEEIPYGCEVSILQFEEKEGLSVIHAEIHVERKSQKGILIGKQGSMIREIGQAARKDIEDFLGTRVYLELHVRVAEGWKDSLYHLRSFGYAEGNEKI